MKSITHGEVLFEIHPVCEDFERALRARSTPRIEDFLPLVADRGRAPLLRELIALELYYDGAGSDPSSFVDYRRRFPEFEPVVADLERDHSRGPDGADGPAARLEPGTEFGAYEVVREIGRGGMGVVLEARHRQLDRPVALKVLPAVARFDPGANARFEREARAIARLHHGNIVPIFEVGEYEGTPYYAMQLIEGRSLAEHIASERATTTAGADARSPRVRQVLAWTASIARALQYAHDLGVLHRDVKPSNVLIDERGTAWLVDFGLARVDDSDLTQPQDLLGTVRYMAPERFGTGADHDARGDVYALGVTLFEALTLRAAYVESDPTALMRAVIDREVPRLRPALPHASRDLETLVATAAAHEPERRYATAGALADDIDRLLAGLPIAARRPSVAERSWRWTRRNRAAAAALALSIVVAVVAVAFAVVFERQKSNISRLSGEVGGLLAQSEEARATLRRALYRSDMQRCVEGIGLPERGAAVRRALERWIPGDGEPDLRGWEWWFMDARTGGVLASAWAVDAGGACIDSAGGLVAMGGRGGVSLWSAVSGELLRTLSTGGHPSDVQLNPSGERVAVCSLAGVEVFDVETGARLGSLPSSGGATAWTPAGDLLLVGRPDLVLWDPVGGEPPAVLAEGGAEGEFCTDPSGERVAFISGRALRVVDVRSGAVLAEASGPDYVGDVSAAADGGRLAAMCREPAIRVYAFDTAEELLRIEREHPATINSIDWSADGTRLAAGLADSTVSVFDTLTGAHLRSFLGHEGNVLGVAFADGSPNVLAATSRGGNLRLWDLDSPNAHVRLALGAAASRSGMDRLDWSVDGTTLRSFSSVGVDRWRLNGDVPEHASELGPWVLARSPDGAQRVEVGGEGLVIRDEGTGRVVFDGAALGVRYDRRPPNALAHTRFTSDGSRCVVGVAGALHVVEGLPERGRLRTVDTDVVRYGFDVDAAGARIFAESWDTIRAVDLATGDVVAEAPSSYFDVPGHEFRHVFCGPQPDQLAVVHGTRLLVLDGSDLSLRAVHVDHASVISCLAWSPDGARIATGSHDQTVGLFDPLEGLAVSIPCEGRIESVAWSPDGTRLAALVEGAHVEVWSAARDSVDRAQGDRGIGVRQR